MKRILLSFILITSTISMFSQKSVPSDAAILKLMNVKRGMATVNSLINEMPKSLDTKKSIEFKRLLNSNKMDLINTSIRTFKAEYTAKEIDFIYNECTSDIIDYSDLTNNFFKKWRHLKGELFFGKAKQLYSKYK